MTTLKGRVIRGIDATAASFLNTFERLPSEAIKAEVRGVIQAMFGQDLDTAPRKWHMHQAVGKDVPSRLNDKNKVAAWTLHVTADDAYKASFTYENGVAYFRLVDTHQVIDKRP